MISEFVARHFWVFSATIFLLFFLGLIGVSFISPIYVTYFKNCVQFGVAVFIIYSFFPKRSAVHLKHEYRNVVFASGILLLLNLFSGEIYTLYRFLRNRFGWTFLPAITPT